MSLGVQSNGFDNGTNGSAATTSTIASSGYGFKVGGTASVVTFTSADAIFGLLGIGMPRTGGHTFVVFTNQALNTTDISFSFGFTYKTARPDQDDYLFDVRTLGGSPTSIVRMKCTASTGIPFVQALGSTVGTGATALVAGTQYRVDVRIHISATVGQIHIDFFDPFSSVPKFTGFSLTGQNTGSTNIGDIFYGPSGTNTVSVGTFVLDLCRFDDTQSSAYMATPTPSNINYNAARQTMGFWAQPGKLTLDFLPTTGVIGFSARPGVLTVGSANTTIHAARAALGFSAVPGVLSTNTLGNTHLDGGPGSLGFAATPGTLSFSNVVTSRASMGFAARPGVLTLQVDESDVFISFGLTDRDQWSFGRADTA